MAKKGIISILTLYVLGSAIVFYFTAWYVNNPDTFQYLSIARKYAGGHWSLALNAYWSPLLSWLLVPFLWTGLHGVIALKILQFIIGGFALVAWFSLTEKTGLKNGLLLTVRLIVVPFVISYAQLSPTADLLFLTVLVFLLSEISIGSWLAPSKQSLIVGILGALLFFSKAFGFPLFLALILSSAWIRYSMYKSRLIWGFALKTILVFIALSSCWIIPLSIKNNELTLSKAASFNLSREVSPRHEQIMQIPVLSDGLHAPPDSLSASAWEAPGDVVSLTPLKPFSNSADRAFYLQLIKRNLLTIYYFDFRHQVGFFFVLLLLGFLLLNGRKRFFENKLILLLFIVFILIYAGYSLILVHTRYVWICTWIMILLSAWVVQSFSEKKFFRNLGSLCFALLVLVAIKRPLKEIFFAEDKDVSLLWVGKALFHPIDTLTIIYREDKMLHRVAQKLKADNLIVGNVASLENTSPLRHYYSASLFLSCELPVHYYGQLKAAQSYEDQIIELGKNNIRYLFVWEGESWKQAENAGNSPIFTDINSGLSIYETDHLEIE